MAGFMQALLDAIVKDKVKITGNEEDEKQIASMREDRRNKAREVQGAYGRDLMASND